MSFLVGVTLAVSLITLLIIIRLYVVVKNGESCRPGAKGAVPILVVAGSGGHTTEILRLMESLSTAYTPRHYVIADTDRMSEEKIYTFERSKQHSKESEFTIFRIPRSREVHQSWGSSVISTLNALRYSFPLVFRLRPDMYPLGLIGGGGGLKLRQDLCASVVMEGKVLCNGPGTCVPPCAAGLLLGILGMKKVLIVYVESICRVQTLSLTGKIIYPISDYFFVQWPSLRNIYPKSIFLGRIV